MIIPPIYLAIKAKDISYQTGGKVTVAIAQFAD